ncbi:MaoC family dehydratase [Aeromicrobium sp. SMF47]|uniref:MaoC family dehydratase n=1 Tax=Aeromicrobium yanjiei TaxID=2662028 RepID=A0A5Q2MEB4_9ACTN|nr:MULTISPECIES: MaoC family dehydratase [Aeromicrobium]MRJ75531.1 MaoC family dehydratase [Aeromicrobium yanjiei]MRK02445.1 MaoC family dehydratase [Aeromicrobium sp. S22]QGG40049.1 MaoC family dehydratase [Aeromicrobium yanjiei]
MSAAPVVIDSAEVLHGLVGVELGPSRPLVVTQERIDAFADATGDHQWIHVDPERAADGPYGGTIAHGYLTLSLVSGLSDDLFVVELGSARINYGVDRARFPSPVPVGSTLRASCTVVDVVDRDSSWLVTYRFTMQVEGQDRPACVVDKLSLILA